MDPVTAALNTATALLTLATKIWDATSPEMKTKEADAWAKFFLGLGAQILDLQAKLDFRPAGQTHVRNP